MSTTVGTLRLKTGLAEMLKGGVIMDVTDETQARIAEDAGAVAVMALERVPSDIRRDGGVARMADPEIIQRIMSTVSIPVMAKCRIGHFAEARVLEALGVDFIDESEVLTPADEQFHVDKHAFTIPFVCGCRDLGEALRRIGEGAALLRTKGEAGTGDVVEAVRHIRAVTSAIRRLTTLGAEELMAEAKTLGAPYELVRVVAAEGKLPVPNFAAGGIATPADAALMRALGAEAVFVGSGIFKSGEPQKRARAIVRATTHYDDAQDRGRGLARSGRGDARGGGREDPDGREAGDEGLVTGEGARSTRRSTRSTSGRASSSPPTLRRFDREAIHAFLTRSYWAEGIPREIVDRAIEGSLVLRPLRGRAADRLRARGHGSRHVRLPGRRLRPGEPPRSRPRPLARRVRHWPTPISRDCAVSVSCTRDAHDLYRRFGFEALRAPERYMEKVLPEPLPTHGDAREPGPGRPRPAGGLRGPCGPSSRPRPRSASGAPRSRARRARGPRHPRRREHDPAPPDGGRALVRRSTHLSRARRLPVRHLRRRHSPGPRGQGSRPAEPRPPRCHDRPQRLRPPGGFLRGRSGAARLGDPGEGCLHPGAPVRRPRPEGRGAGPPRRRAGPRARGPRPGRDLPSGDHGRSVRPPVVPRDGRGRASGTGRGRRLSARRAGSPDSGPSPCRRSRATIGRRPGAAGRSRTPP